MGGCLGLKNAAAFVVVLLVAAQVAVAGANLIRVGGKTGWKPNTNYTEWSSQQKFYVGDWLMFWFTDERYQYDVLEVNETNYMSCNSQEFIKNVTGGAGRDVFQLTEPKTYYFICSKGYCWGGMKVAITVLQLPSPQPSPTKSNSNSNSVTKMTLTNPLFFIVPLSFLILFLV